MTINEEILNAEIRHMVWLERYKTSNVKKIITLLNKSNEDLTDKITARLIKIDERGFDLGKDTTKRLQALEEMLAVERLALSKLLFDETRDELNEFAIYEADFQARVIEGAVAQVASVQLDRPSATRLKAIATSKPFQGRLLKQWYSDLAADQAKKIRDAVQIGMVEGETTDQIVRRIRGTRALKYSDGVMNITRRNAETIVRTAVAHVADRASNDVWDANADIIKGLKWVSTLDNRTSPICRERDGKIYKVGKVPVIPAHFGCRSRTVPYLGESSIKGTRASQFGPVPEDMTYGDWLKKQPVSVQEEVLGVAKAKLYRKGGLPLDRFQDSKGHEYTLAELKVRDARVWEEVFQ